MELWSQLFLSSLSGEADNFVLENITSLLERLMVEVEICSRKEQYDPRCITKLVSNVSAKRLVIVILLVIQVTAVCRLTVCVCVVCVCMCVTVKLTIFSFNTITCLILLHGGAGGRVLSKAVNRRKNLKYTIKYTGDDHP